MSLWSAFGFTIILSLYVSPLKNRIKEVLGSLYAKLVQACCKNKQMQRINALQRFFMDGLYFKSCSVIVMFLF